MAKCSNASCHMIGTEAFRFGLCSACLSRLTTRAYDQLADASDWLPSDHPTTTINKTVYVPTPRMRWAMLLALGMGLVGGFLSRFF